MIQTLFASPLTFFFSLLGLTIAITIHEFAHALAADRLGDPTPRAMGRLSLNPLRHLDPFGTISMLLVGFGWGKPVPFDPYNLTQPRRDAAIISIAGPISNLSLALVLSLLERIILINTPFYGLTFPILYLNVMLAIFNLVPVGPLDGQKILSGLLPRDLAYEFEMIMSRYGTIILLAMILPIFGSSAPISQLISPIISFIIRLLIPSSF